MTGEIARIEGIAIQLRRAMELADYSQCAINLLDFPSQCCHHASSLLLVLLNECGIDGFAIYRGRQPDWSEEQWHNWIQRDNIVVDITADQFGKSLTPVIVGESSWHMQLSEVEKTPDRLREFDIPFYKSETKIYDRTVATGVLTCLRSFLG